MRQSLIDESKLAKLFQPTSFYLTFPPYLLICRRVTTWLEINLSSWEVPTERLSPGPASPSPSLTCRNMPNISRLMGAPPYESLYLPRDETGDPRNISFSFPDSPSAHYCWHGDALTGKFVVSNLSLNNVVLQSSTENWWELKHFERKKTPRHVRQRFNYSHHMYVDWR